MDQRESELREMIRECLDDLETNEEIHMVGRTADGEKIYGSLEPPTLLGRLRESVSVILVFPALICEYAFGYTALMFKRLNGARNVGLWLADQAGRLRFWRYCRNQSVWPSIKG